MDGHGASINARRGLMTMSHLGAILDKRILTASRSLRFMRFRFTAFPSARGSVKPMRGPSTRSWGSKKAVNSEPETRVP